MSETCWKQQKTKEEDYQSNYYAHTILVVKETSDTILWCLEPERCH